MQEKITKRLIGLLLLCPTFSYAISGRAEAIVRFDPAGGCRTRADAIGIGRGYYNTDKSEKVVFDGISISGDLTGNSGGNYVYVKEPTKNNETGGMGSKSIRVTYTVRYSNGIGVTVPGVGIGGGTNITNQMNEYADGSATSGVTLDNSGPDSCSAKAKNLKRGFAGPGMNVEVVNNPTDVGCAGAEQFTTYTPAMREISQQYSRDKLGNRSSSPHCVEKWRYDGTPPVCRVTGQSTTAWTRDPVTVYAQGYDSGVGMGSVTNAVATQEDQTVQISCKDLLNNKRSVDYFVGNIDLSNPNCGNAHIPNPGPGRYTNTPIPITVDCHDSRSGCTAGQYTEYIGGGSGQINIADIVGNGNSCPVSYGFWDSTAPSVNISFASPHQNNSSSQYTRDDKIRVIVTGGDNAAGVNRVCYSLSGATSQGEVCVAGSRAEFDISNEGVTNITAWSFDNALAYNGGAWTHNGNRSSDAHKSAYIDRTIPTFTITTNYDSKLNNDDNSKWQNELIRTSVTGTDSNNATGRDSSSSGISSVEVYYGITNNPNDVWGNLSQSCKSGNADSVTNRLWCSYASKNVNDKGVKDRGAAVASRPSKVYGTPQLDALPVIGSYNGNPTSKTYSATLTMPNSFALNDEIYAHIRVCDNTYTGGTKAPHCTTGVYGPIFFDNLPPDFDKQPDKNGNDNNDKNRNDDIIAILPPDTITPSNPSTDPDNPTTNPSTPQGGNGSGTITPDKLPGSNEPDKNGGDDNKDGATDYREFSTLSNHDWTNKLIVGFKTQEAQAMKEDGSGYRANSGLDRMEFYYDTNYLHEDASKFNPSNSSYPNSYNNVRMDCSNGNNKNAQTCAYLLDFNSLSDYRGGAQVNHSVMEEGARFIKVNAVDLAGNVKSAYFGPYKFDITKNIIEQMQFKGPQGLFIEK